MKKFTVNDLCDFLRLFFFSDVVDSGGVMRWTSSLSDCHLYRSRLSTSVCTY